MDSLKSKWVRMVASSRNVSGLLDFNEDIYLDVLDQLSLDHCGLFKPLILSFGGVLARHWIRIFGCGELNILKKNHLYPCDYLLVAEDVLCGLFGIDEEGNMHYLAANQKTWENLEMDAYTFIHWVLNEDFWDFYDSSLYEKYKEQVDELDVSQGINTQEEICLIDEFHQDHLQCVEDDLFEDFFNHDLSF